MSARSSARPRLLIAGTVAIVLAAALGIALANTGGATAASGATKSSPTDRTRLPLGDGKVSTTGARRGWIYACNAGNPAGGGAFQDGPWIDTKHKLFNEKAKARVDGSVDWPAATVRFTTSSSGGITVTGNGLPTNRTTGTYPIAPGDDAYGYDRNPNTIKAQTVTFNLPKGTAAATPSCLGGGAIGIALNGVQFFDGLDALNRDAVAHETQDACDGHPERSGTYHYHAMPACLWSTQSRTKQSPQFGYARDGYPIYGPRGTGGKLLTNKDLDVCHGTTSTVTLNGRRVRTYHYVATLEYPYTLGCYHGTPGG